MRAIFEGAMAKQQSMKQCQVSSLMSGHDFIISCGYTFGNVFAGYPIVK